MENKQIATLTAMMIGISLFTAHLVPAFGSSEESASKENIKQISKTKIGSAYLYFFKYCTPNNPNIIGFQAISNIESVPVLVSSNSKVGECQIYGAKIHTDNADMVKTKLFTISDLSNLIKNYENKKMSLENKLAKEQQQLIIHYKTNESNEKIIKQIDAIASLKEWIKSTKNSIILLKSV